MQLKWYKTDNIKYKNLTSFIRHVRPMTPIILQISCCWCKYGPWM